MSPSPFISNSAIQRPLSYWPFFVSFFLRFSFLEGKHDSSSRWSITTEIDDGQWSTVIERACLCVYTVHNTYVCSIMVVGLLAASAATAAETETAGPTRPSISLATGIRGWAGSLYRRRYYQNNNNSNNPATHSLPSL